MKLWGGRFLNDENKLMEDFNSSLSFDRRLYYEDIIGSLAHVRMLESSGIITNEEYLAIKNGLEGILEDVKQGILSIEGEYEDIHSFIEINLIKRIGEVGKKLHTARSRNDQVAVDLRMYTKKILAKVIEELEALIGALLKLSQENCYLMPGYTHMQRAQVVTFSHHVEAYYNMILRDKKRLLNTLSVMDESPLGCCALAGTTYSTDREMTAKELGFSKPMENFLDGVSDRDYVIESLSDFSIVMMHLSRLSEELIIWSTKEFDFIQIDDEFSTGSSIMPQKKNPDAAELIRGKTGRVYGSLMSLLTTMKGLPLAYNKDMQEDKEPFFDAVDTVLSCVKVMTAMILTITVKKENMYNAVKKGFLNATEAADYLVHKGMPFRDAHKVIGELVIYCEREDKAIEELQICELKKINPLFSEDVYDFIDYETTLNRGIKKNMKK